MAKFMTKAQIAAHIASKFELTKKNSTQILEELANLAARQAKNGFVFPGVGKLVVVNRKVRMGRNPQTGEAIKIPAKMVIKFRIAKAMKEAVLNGHGSRSTARSGAKRHEYEVIRVWYATDRRATKRPKPAHMFDTGRGELAFGVCEVSIPTDHRMGDLEGPSVLRLEFRSDPRRHVHLLAAQPMAWEEFRTRVNAGLAESQGREILVFVHGFNVSFADAVRRTGQVAYDLRFDGVAIAYCWPSQASFPKYPIDETNVEWTAPHLAEALRRLQSQLEARVIHLIGHSMGNRALTRVLAESLQGADAGPGAARISQVILTAPDIDAGVFCGLAQRLAANAMRVTLYASSKDKALHASKKFHGYLRAGEAGDGLTVVEGVDTVDVSALETNLIGHSYYGEHHSVLSDIFQLLRHGFAPTQRFGLQARTKNGLTYWEFRLGL